MSKINNNQHEIQNSPLGKHTNYVSNYSPELLYFIPREPNRRQIVPSGQLNSLPFIGLDIWNAYEVSWLDHRGIPHVAIGEIMYSSGSPFLVESKSLKLYLNSLNGSKFTSASEVAEVISRDLGLGVKSPVCVKIYEQGEWMNSHFSRLDKNPIDNKQPGSLGRIVDLDCTLSAHCEEKNFGISDLYEELQEDDLFVNGDNINNIDYLGGDRDYFGKLADFNNNFTDYADLSEEIFPKIIYFSRKLRSLCPVTGQPDWGNIYIECDGDFCQKKALKIALYLIQKRELAMFHEQCVEKIFMDIFRAWKPKFLRVWANYTRRGGIDINPYRVLFLERKMSAPEVDSREHTNFNQFDNRDLVYNVTDNIDFILKLLPDRQRDIRQ